MVNRSGSKFLKIYKVNLYPKFLYVIYCYILKRALLLGGLKI